MKTNLIHQICLEEESKFLSEIETEIRTLLGTCPRAGNGVHDWTFNTALKLQGQYGLEAHQVEQMLAEATENCGRPVDEREIADSVRNSRAIVTGEAPTRSTPIWPVTNPEQIAEITEGGSLGILRVLSPERFADDKPHAEEVIDALFPGNPLLCVASSQWSSETAPREQFRGRLSAMQFVVPSPMTKVYGETKGGKKPSMRTLNNTGPRRFQAVEFDQGSKDEQAALLLHLMEYAPLALVVDSGGKSLHGWFYCAHADEVRQLEFMRYAVSLGADKATFTKCQLVRMPDGTRDSGVRQVVQFFNPAILEAQ